MTEFLLSTRYCDFDHPTVLGALAAVRDGTRDIRSVAVRLFRFVRDEVRYAFHPWGTLASETLQCRVGTCTNKSNLLVALLRAAAIPAAYGILRVNGRDYFGNIAPPFLKPLVSANSTHIYAAAYLDGQWIRCDPSTDSELAGKTAHFCRQTRLVEWDGAQDALDFLQPHHVYTDIGLRPTVDALLDKPPRHADPTTLGILNEYLHFIRTHPPFRSAEALLAAYQEHCGEERPRR